MGSTLARMAKPWSPTPTLGQLAFWIFQRRGSSLQPTVISSKAVAPQLLKASIFASTSPNASALFEYMHSFGSTFLTVRSLQDSDPNSLEYSTVARTVLRIRKLSSRWMCKPATHGDAPAETPGPACRLSRGRSRKLVVYTPEKTAQNGPSTEGERATKT